VRLESTGFLERDPLRDGGFFKNRPQNALARKPELRSSPERGYRLKGSNSNLWTESR